MVVAIGIGQSVSGDKASAAAGDLTYQSCITADSNVIGCAPIPGAVAGGTNTGLNAPYSLALSPDGASLYTASSLGDAVARFTRNPATGAVTYQGCITSNTGIAGCAQIPGAATGGTNTSLNGVRALALSPDGANLYALSGLGDAVARFTRNPATGALVYQDCIASDSSVTGCTQIPGSTAGGANTGLDDLRSLALSPDGTSLYTASQQGDAVARFDRNPANGALNHEGCITSNLSVTGCTQISGAGTGGTDTGLNSLTSLALSPDGASLYTASDLGDAVARFDRNPATGALVYEGCIASNSNVAGCSKIPGATAGGTNTGLDNLASLSPSPDGNGLYTASVLGDAIARFARNPATGALNYEGCITSNLSVTGCTQIPGSTAGGANTGLDALTSVALGPDGANLYAVSGLRDAVAHFTRNPATGGLTYQGCITSDSIVTGCTQIPGATTGGTNTGLNSLTSLALSSDGANLYTASEFGDAVASFDVEPPPPPPVDNFNMTYQDCITSDSNVAGCAPIPGAVATGTNTGLNSLVSIAPSPDGVSLYAASIGSSAVSRFNRDPATGALAYQDCIASDSNVAGCTQIPGATSGGINTGLSFLISLAPSPDGTSLYTASAFGAAVARFTRNPATGALTYQGCITSNTGVTGCTPIPGAAAGGTNTGLSLLVSLAPSPDGTSLYAASTGGDAIARFNRNPATGALTYADCITSNSNVAGCTQVPGATAGGTGTGLDGLYSISLSPGGAYLYTASKEGDAIARFTRNPATGALAYQDCITSNSSVASCTQVPGATAGGTGTGLDSLQSITSSPDGTNLYTASTEGDAVARFTRNPTTGALTYEGCITSDSSVTACSAISGATAGGTGTGLDGLYSIALSPGGANLYTASNESDAVTHFTRDPDTGALTYEGCLTSDSSVAACVQIPAAAAGGTGTGLDSLASLTISPDGASLYVASNLGHAVARFDLVADPAPPPLPNNNFTIKKLKLKPKQGTAVLPVVLPGAGKLKLLASKNVKAATVTRNAAGQAKLTVKPKGKAKKTLKKKGKVKIKVKVTFTPTGGEPRTKTKQITLRLKR